MLGGLRHAGGPTTRLFTRRSGVLRLRRTLPLVLAGRVPAGREWSLMRRLELYAFRFRDLLTCKWVRARHKLLAPEIQRRYSEWELIGAPEIQNVESAPNIVQYNPFPAELLGRRSRPTTATLVEVQNVVTRSPPNHPVLWQPGGVVAVAEKRPVTPVMFTCISKS